MPLCSRCNAPQEPDGHAGRRSAHPVAAGLAWLSVALLSLWQGAQLYLFYLRQTRFPQCDAAIHGFQGYALARDLGGGRLLRFLHELISQDWWPFGFSLLLVPFQLAADWLGASSYHASALLVAACYALLPLAVLWTARELDPGPAGLWAGAIAGGMFLFGPLHQLYAILVMREVPGALFLTVTVGLYLRASRLRTLGAYRLAGGSLLAVFFIKYNFGLLLALPLLIAEYQDLAPRQRDGLRQAVWPSAGSRRARWARLAAVAYGGAAIGWWTLGGEPADLLYPALAAAFGLLAGWACVRRAEFSACVGRLSLAARAFLETVALPLWVWLLIPWHLYSFMDYLHLASRPRGVLEKHSYSGGILIYLETILRDIAPFPAAGALVLATLLASALWLRRLSQPLRGFMIIALAQLLLVVFHPSESKDPRFLITGAPAMLLAAGLAWAGLAGRLVGKTPWLKNGLLSAVAALMVGLPSAAGPDARLPVAYRENTADPAVALCLDRVAELPDWSKTTAILGGFNQVSASLIAWEVQQRLPDTLLDLVRLPRWAAQGRAAGDWLLSKGVGQIVAIRLLPDCPWRSDPDYVAFNAWQLDVIDAIAADARWALARLGRVPELGLEVLVLEPAGQSAASGRPRSSAGK